MGNQNGRREITRREVPCSNKQILGRGLYEKESASSSSNKGQEQ